MPRVRSRSDPALTVPDLVVLSLLAERPMHGYELVAELERRDARDWAGVSRPQVYYSLRKLAAAGHVAPAAATDDPPALGPERQVVAITAGGRRALARGLARETWATQRERPPFLTWLAISPHASAEARARVVAQRRAYLEAELARERATLGTIEAEAAVTAAPKGPMLGPARLMVGLVVRQMEAELAWLDEVERAFGLGATASRRGRGR